MHYLHTWLPRTVALAIGLAVRLSAPIRCKQLNNTDPEGTLTGLVLMRQAHRVVSLAPLKYEAILCMRGAPLALGSTLLGLQP